MAVAAFVVPLLFALIPGAFVPTIVGEVLAGIALGESWLGWIERGPWIDFLFLFGLAFLLFLGGLELDFDLVRASLSGGMRAVTTSPVGLAIFAMAIRLVLAFAITIPLGIAGLLAGSTLVALLLTSTSLGVVLSVLAERGLLREPYGQRLIVNAAVADFSTVLLVPIFFSADTHSTATQLALIGLLVALALALLVGLCIATGLRGAGHFRLPS
ncbi:MAG: cation:proton antiporter [Actinomycetota bacterium]|nr:cation:proton antiporter [Actinomycetota bacterium]